MLEQPDPKHQIPEGLKPQEMYKGVPILASQVVNWLKVRTKMSVDGLCVRRFTQILHG